LRARDGVRAASVVGLVLAACRTDLAVTGDAPDGRGGASASSHAASAAATPLPPGDVAAPSGLRLAVVDAREPAVATSIPLVTVSTTELLVDSHRIAAVSEGPLGFAADLKRAGNRSALQVLPLEASLRALRERDPSQTTLRIRVDGRTAYRTAIEVIFTASHAGFTTFAFGVHPASGPDAEQTVPASVPSRAEWDASHKAGAPQAPSFVLQPDGASLTIGTDSVGAGCTLGASGVAVPAIGGRLDVTAIAACASRVKTMRPAWGGVRAANVSAAPGLDMQTVLSVVAGLEKTYPSVHFGLLSG
jgi:hypothetical protein